jgi:hypothetical protein
MAYGPFNGPIEKRFPAASEIRAFLAGLVFFVLLALLICRPALASPLSAPVSSVQVLTKAQLLEGLKGLQRKHLQDIETLNQSIRRIMQEAQTVSLKGNEDVATGKLLQSIPARLSHLQTQREEFLLRRDFMDQLIFQIDSKYGTQGAALFLERTLLDMAITELTASSPSKNELWRFYTYLSIAIREIPEPREDLLAFMAGYMDFSSLRSPKSPLVYLSSRHYTNGAISQSARPVRREDVGSLVENRLKELSLSGSIRAAEPDKADFELRTRVTAPTPATKVRQ